MYATSSPNKHRKIQDNLRIDLFARKHNLTIENIEIALELDDKERKAYLKKVSKAN